MLNMVPGNLQPVTYSTISENASGNTFISTALRIGGTSGPFHQLHMSDGNLFMEGGGEVGHIVKRLINNSGTAGPLGTRTNPIFTDKRISQAGDGDFEVKTLFSADEEAERVIFKWDSKGIFATIGKSGLLGRQNEGYLEDGHVNPWYAINSEGSEHRYELGPGGASDMDTAITRTDTQSISLQVGPNSTSLQSKLTVYGDAVVVQSGCSLIMPHLTTPAASGAGTNKLYFKSDDNLYKIDSAGTETAIGGGGGASYQESVLLSADDSIVITLDSAIELGNVADISVMVKLDDSINPDFYIYTNNGISNFNYRMTGSTNTTGTNPRVARISSGSAGDEIFISGKIGLTVDGNVIGKFNFTHDGLVYYGDAYIFQTTTSASITSITVSHNNAVSALDSFAIGSKIRVLK